VSVVAGLPVRVKMSRTTRFVGAAVLPQQADPPAGGRHFRVGPTTDMTALWDGRELEYTTTSTESEIN
jgi:hypothetical protein